MRGIFRFTALAALLFAVQAAAVVPVAQGGSFSVRQCEGSGYTDFFAQFSFVNRDGQVDALAGCHPTGAQKIGIYQNRNGVNLIQGAGGQFRWDAPAGIEVIATRMTARLRNANGINAELIGFDGASTVNLDQGVPHDGESRTSHWSGPGRPQSMVVARLVCHFAGPCANQPASTRAFMELTDAEFTARDSRAPSVAVSGTLWNWAGDSGYHRGAAPIRVDAGDQGGGVAAVWVEVNGFPVDLAAPSCPGHRVSYATRFTPCPLSLSRTQTLDTAKAPFQEGGNQIRACASDYADAPSQANTTCSATRNVLVDNRGSSPPRNLRVLEGSDWLPTNSFNLGWSLPPGQTSPVIGAVYVFHDPESDAQVGGGYLEGADAQSGGTVQVPGIGEYRVRVYLLDAALNLGEPGEAMLRFDDGPPGDVSPEPASGWISADELPLRQEIERAEAGGPSGVSGYALAVSRSGPEPPCGSFVCLAPEITLNGGPEDRIGSVGGMAEGSHWVSAVAVSGAGKPSLEPGITMVRVDKTPPETTISGVPGGWVNHPVTVTVRATDDLSGMQADPDDDGRPATFIEAENHAKYEAPGDRATFTVATEGVSRILYWAEDLAGNANDGKASPEGGRHANPGQTSVRIDMTPPRAAFLSERDPDDPERVWLEASDQDSGVAAAVVQIRPAGASGAFSDLETEGGGGRFSARVPSDDLPAGAYELRARVADRAGNEAVADREGSGQPMILNLPLKRGSVLTAKLRNGRVALTARFGVKQFVEGRLLSDGAPLANQPVAVTEEFPSGSRQTTRISRVRTDGAGRYRTRLATGPSRKIRVAYEGSPTVARTGAAPLRLGVRGKVKFRLKPRKLRNGAVARMSGAVGFKGALPPARGKLVAIQYLDPERRKWRPVEVLRSDRRGRFRFRYRFRTITSPQKIIFRASVLPEAGWPYLPSTSRRRSVIVYPKG